MAEQAGNEGIGVRILLQNQRRGKMPEQMRMNVDPAVLADRLGDLSAQADLALVRVRLAREERSSGPVGEPRQVGGRVLAEEGERLALEVERDALIVLARLEGELGVAQAPWPGEDDMDVELEVKEIVEADRRDEQNLDGDCRLDEDGRFLRVLDLARLGEQQLRQEEELHLNVGVEKRTEPLNIPGRSSPCGGN